MRNMTKRVKKDYHNCNKDEFQSMTSETTCVTRTQTHKNVIDHSVQKQCNPKTGANMKRKILFLISMVSLSSFSLANAANEKDLPSNANAQKQSSSVIQDWWDGDTLTGNWGGVRDDLKNRGIDLQASYTGAVLGNVIGGYKKGATYNDSFGVSLDVNFGKLFKEHSLNNTKFHIDVVQRDGNNLSAEYIRNQYPVSQSYGGQNFRLNELYLQQYWANKEISFKIGRLDASNDFLSSDIYCQFVNNAFCGSPIGIFYNVPFSAYPNAQWGAIVSAQSNYVVAKFGVYNTNESVSENKYHGFNFSFNGDQGVQLIGSIGYLLNNNQRYAGHYTFGMTYFTGPNENPAYYGQNSGTYDRRDTGYYLQADQAIYDQGIRTLKTFLTIEYFNHWESNYMPLFVDGGFTFKGINPYRPNDTAGLGFAYGRYGRDVITQKGANFGYEMNIDLNYKIQVNKWLAIQPDLQYIIHPYGGSTQLSGTPSSPPNALVVATQVQIAI